MMKNKKWKQKNKKNANVIAKKNKKKNIKNLSKRITLVKLRKFTNLLMKMEKW